METNDLDLTQILQRVGEGDPEAWREALPQVYATLKEIAHRFMGRQSPGHTLQTTALVHEAYVKLVRQDGGWESRRHFEMVAARAMRHILVDHARTKLAAKRGGGHLREELTDQAQVQDRAPFSALELDEALERLTERAPELARVAELRCFGGLDHAAIADVLGVSERSVDRRWSEARVWLRRELADA